MHQDWVIYEVSELQIHQEQLEFPPALHSPAQPSVEQSRAEPCLIVHMLPMLMRCHFSDQNALRQQGKSWTNVQGRKETTEKAQKKTRETDRTKSQREKNGDGKKGEYVIFFFFSTHSRTPGNEKTKKEESFLPVSLFHRSCVLSLRHPLSSSLPLSLLFCSSSLCSS